MKPRANHGLPARAETRRPVIAHDYMKLLIEHDMPEDAEAALGQFLDEIKFVMSDERGTWTTEQF